MDNRNGQKHTSAIWQQASIISQLLNTCLPWRWVGGGGLRSEGGERQTQRERELYLEFVSRFSLTNRVMLIVHCSVHNRSSLNANVWYTWYYFTNVRPPPPPPHRPSPPSPTPSFLFVCMLYWFTHSSRQATALGKIGQHWFWTVVLQKKKNATTNVNM